MESNEKIAALIKAAINNALNEWLAKYELKRHRVYDELRDALNAAIEQQPTGGGEDGCPECSGDCSAAPKPPLYCPHLPPTQPAAPQAEGDDKWEDVHLRVYKDDQYNGPGHKCISYRGVIYRPDIQLPHIAKG